MKSTIRRDEADTAAEEISECSALFRQLSIEGKQAALAIARWLVEDGRPETDPRRHDPYWQKFEHLRLQAADDAQASLHTQSEQAPWPSVSTA